jgi:hypothetical protein
VHRGVLGEQLHRLEGGQLARGGEIGGRDCQRGNPEDVLPADAQRLPARDQQARPRAGPHHGVGQLGRRAEHVLGVVEDHQQVPVADRVDQGVEHGPSRLLADSEHGGHGAGHQLGSATGASSTSHTPSPAPSSASAATCNARRDLPIPPGPAIVTSRDPPDTSDRSSASSAARPTKLVACEGRLWCSAGVFVMSVLTAALLASPSVASAIPGRALSGTGKEPVAVGTGGAVASMDLDASKAGIDGAEAWRQRYRCRRCDGEHAGSD